MVEYGWEFWADAKQTEGTTRDGWRVFKKDGLVCECREGVEPGDADSMIWKDRADKPYKWKHE